MFFVVKKTVSRKTAKIGRFLQPFLSDTFCADWQLEKGYSA